VPRSRLTRRTREPSAEIVRIPMEIGLFLEIGRNHLTEMGNNGKCEIEPREEREVVSLRCKETGVLAYHVVQQLRIGDL
jgi:hypothetical protein